MTEGDELELFATLSVQSFVLEVVLANDFARLPSGQRALENFRDDLLHRIEHRSTLPPGEQASVDEMTEMQARMLVICRRLFQRIESRRAEVVRGSG